MILNKKLTILGCYDRLNLVFETKKNWEPLGSPQFEIIVFRQFLKMLPASISNWKVSSTYQTARQPPKVSLSKVYYNDK